MKIAILGSAPSSLPHAPFKNTAYLEFVEGRIEELARCHGQIGGDFDIWGCSPACWAQSPRATRWFEVHRWEPGRDWFSAEYVKFLQGFRGIVYTGGVVPEIPNHVVYPIDRMEEKFSSYFMNSSVSLMLALAIDTIEQIRNARFARDASLLPAAVDTSELDKDESDDVIGLWGIDMAATEEYAFQRPGCQFFVLEAMRRGIGMFLPPESDLMRPMPVYGISEWDHNYIKLTTRAREISAKVNRAQVSAKEGERDFLVSQGEIAALNSFVNTWTSPYGMLAGMVIRQDPGTGLGSGITHFDGRPVSRMSVAPEPPIAAMTQSAEEQDGRAMLARIIEYQQKLGTSEEPAVVLERIMAEADLARAHSAILQPYTRKGEGTRDTMKRLVEGGTQARRKAHGRRR